MESQCTEQPASMTLHWVIHSAQYGFHQRPTLHGRRDRQNENYQHQYDSKK